MYMLVEILISIVIASIPILIYLKKHRKNKKKLLLAILASIILLVGSLIRTIAIESYPVGLNQDEASIGYEAYSILNFGIDRNGISIPVHLISWGSGQNALYCYLIMPFIYLFGNTAFSVRIVMALIGCLTLLVAYFLFKDLFDDKKGLVALFIFSILPWHILKSRWGLESNIFPDLIFYSLTFIYFGVKYQKKKYFIISSIILGISTYAYGTSYLFVPIFSVITYIYLIIKKKITIKNGILYLFITGIVSLPMILFVIINYFNLDGIKIGNITIPRLIYNRADEVTALSGNFFRSCYSNIKGTINILLSQKDGLILNSSDFGLFYNISFPFMILGIYNSIKDKKTIFFKLNNIILISSIALAFFTLPNINRINILWLCLMIYIVIGVLFVFKYFHKYLKYGIIALYGIIFVFFSIDYFTDYQNHIGNLTFSGVEESIKYVSDKEYKDLYITKEVNQPYIYYLYFNKINPNTFIKERNIIYLSNDNDFKVIVHNISNVHFYIPEKIEKGNMYIFTMYDFYDYVKDNINDYVIERFDFYCVIYMR